MRGNRGYGFSVNKRSIGLCSKLMVFIVPLWEKNPALVVRCFNIFF